MEPKVNASQKPGKPWTYKDENGTRFYKEYIDHHWVYHRKNGPAIIEANGTAHWFLNGERHREGGPAVEYPKDGRWDDLWYHYNIQYKPKDNTLEESRMFPDKPTMFKREDWDDGDLAPGQFDKALETYNHINHAFKALNEVYAKFLLGWEGGQMDELYYVRDENGMVYFPDGQQLTPTGNYGWWDSDLKYEEDAIEKLQFIMKKLSKNAKRKNKRSVDQLIKRDTIKEETEQPSKIKGLHNTLEAYIRAYVWQILEWDKKHPDSPHKRDSVEDFLGMLMMQINEQEYLMAAYKESKPHKVEGYAKKVWNGVKASDRFKDMFDQHGRYINESIGQKGVEGLKPSYFNEHPVLPDKAILYLINAATSGDAMFFPIEAYDDLDEALTELKNRLQEVEIKWASEDLRAKNSMSEYIEYAVMVEDPHVNARSGDANMYRQYGTTNFGNNWWENEEVTMARKKIANYKKRLQRYPAEKQIDESSDDQTPRQQLKQVMKDYFRVESPHGSKDAYKFMYKRMMNASERPVIGALETFKRIKEWEAEGKFGDVGQAIGSINNNFEDDYRRNQQKKQIKVSEGAEGPDPKEGVWQLSKYFWNDQRYEPIKDFDNEHDALEALKHEMLVSYLATWETKQVQPHPPKELRYSVHVTDPEGGEFGSDGTYYRNNGHTSTWLDDYWITKKAMKAYRDPRYRDLYTPNMLAYFKQSRKIELDSANESCNIKPHELKLIENINNTPTERKNRKYYTKRYVELMDNLDKSQYDSFGPTFYEDARKEYYDFFTNTSGGLLLEDFQDKELQEFVKPYVIELHNPKYLIGILSSYPSSGWQIDVDVKNISNYIPKPNTDGQALGIIHFKNDNDVQAFLTMLSLGFGGKYKINIHNNSDFNYIMNESANESISEATHQLELIADQENSIEHWVKNQFWGEKENKSYNIPKFVDFKQSATYEHLIDHAVKQFEVKPHKVEKAVRKFFNQMVEFELRYHEWTENNLVNESAEPIELGDAFVNWMAVYVKEVGGTWDEFKENKTFKAYVKAHNLRPHKFIKAAQKKFVEIDEFEQSYIEWARDVGDQMDDDELYNQLQGGMNESKAPANGDCYKVSADMVMKDQSDQHVLVHGIVTGQGQLEGRRYGHAWVELGDVVFDNSNGNSIVMRKEHYYKLGNINPDEQKRYTPEETLLILCKHKHWGPWEEGVSPEVEGPFNYEPATIKEETNLDKPHNVLKILKKGGDLFRYDDEHHMYSSYDIIVLRWNDPQTDIYHQEQFSKKIMNELFNQYDFRETPGPGGTVFTLIGPKKKSVTEDQKPLPLKINWSDHVNPPDEHDPSAMDSDDRVYYAIEHNDDRYGKLGLSRKWGEDYILYDRNNEEVARTNFPDDLFEMIQNHALDRWVNKYYKTLRHRNSKKGDLYEEQDRQLVMVEKPHKLLKLLKKNPDIRVEIRHHDAVPKPFMKNKIVMNYGTTIEYPIGYVINPEMLEYLKEKGQLHGADYPHHGTSVYRLSYNPLKEPVVEAWRNTEDDVEKIPVIDRPHKLIKILTTLKDVRVIVYRGEMLDIPEDQPWQRNQVESEGYLIAYATKDVMHDLIAQDKIKGETYAYLHKTSYVLKTDDNSLNEAEYNELGNKVVDIDKPHKVIKLLNKYKPARILVFRDASEPRHMRIATTPANARNNLSGNSMLGYVADFSIIQELLDAGKLEHFNPANKAYEFYQLTGTNDAIKKGEYNENKEPKRISKQPAGNRKTAHTD